MNLPTQYGIPLRNRERGEHVLAYMYVLRATHATHMHVHMPATCTCVSSRYRTRDLFASLVTARYLPLSRILSLYNRRIQRTLHIVKSINDQPRDNPRLDQ
ncbi:hypothetical protein P5V15_000562 [Pogonomyrmex californicus]